MLRRNENGFGLVNLAVVILVVVIACSTGYFAFKSNSSNSPTVRKVNNDAQLPKPNATKSVNPDSDIMSDILLGESWAPNQDGYGTVKPSEINNGGDSTGIVQSVTWQSWGDAKAIGTGTSTYVAPGSTVSDGADAQATVVAFNLGSCQGKPAYTAIEWYFPQHGGSFDANTYRNICTGAAVN